MSSNYPNELHIHFSQEKFVSFGELTDIFYSFFCLDGAYYSIHRRFGLVPVNKQDSEVNHSVLVYTKYSNTDDHLTVIEEKILSSNGTDPRVVVDSDTVYVFSFAVESYSPLTTLVRVTKLPSEEEVSFYELPDRPLGKNWQPFIRNGELHILHSFDPETVFRLSFDGSVECISDNPTDNVSEASHDKYTKFRGGTNGLEHESGDIYGFGHITDTNSCHIPFPWKLTLDGNLSRGPAIEFPTLKKQGWNIRDVTSCFIENGRIYLGLALSERDWFHAQRFATLLISVPCESARDIFEHPEKWDKDSVFEGIFEDVKTVFPTSMDSELLCSDSLGTRYCNDKRGIVAYDKEPFVLQNNQAEKFEVTYVSNMPSNQMAGFIRVANYLNARLSVPSKIVELPGTEGTEKTAIFDLQPRNDVDGYKMFITKLDGDIKLDNIRVLSA